MKDLNVSVLVAALLLAPLAALQAAEFHVAADGNDTNPGTAGRPFATLQAAVNALQPGDTLLIRGGTYRETVTFPRSGTAEKPITLKPYPGEKVILSGCAPVTDWTRHKDNVWKAPMDWTLGTGRNQVFAGDEVMIEARHPNQPAPGLEMYVADLSPLWPTFGEFAIPKETRKQQPGRLVSHLLDGQPEDHWKGALYYGVHFEGWSAQTGVIESSKPGEILVGDRTKQWWFASHYPDEGRGMIVGHMNALDQPGEWHWQDNVLYLIPKDGREPVAIAAKRRHLAFDLSGREYIRVEGLHVRAASARLEGSRHCTFDGCHFTYISHFTRHYSIGQVEHGRDTLKSGETGIFVSGRENAFLNCSLRFSAGAGFHLRGYHHVIHNCLIDEVSYVGHYLNAITDAVNDFGDYENLLYGGHTITFNTMRNAGRHLFNIHGNGTSTASRNRGPMDYMATLFAHNHLYNGMLQTRDAGLITGYYGSGGTLNGLNSQVIYNVMHDSYDIAAMRWNSLGIVYLDAGTCDVDLHHNLLWAAPGSLQRGLWYNTMCVDIREHDNVFHPGFTRTSADLQPREFPEGKPFRFGHDFDDPPPLAKWPQLVTRHFEAEQAASSSPGVMRTAVGVTGLNDGEWLALGAVDFNAGWQSAVLRLSSNAKEMNTDKSARAKPRHRRATDPLVLEATTNDGKQDQVRVQWTFIHSVTNGAWLRFNQVPLGQGYRRFRAVYGNNSTAPRRMEIRLDSVSGPLVGQVVLPPTDQPRKGRIQIYGETTVEISAEATGTRDVFMVFRSDDGGPVGEFEYFRFEQYRGQIALQKSEVKLELRAGSKDGLKLGEFYPRFTSGSDVAGDFVATLDPLTGTVPLFLVVRSALPMPIGMLDWISLEKAAQPVDWTAVGLPPRADGQGKMILPQSTNRPRARPSDNYEYTQPRFRRQGSRPLFAATRTIKPPVIDGKLSDWPAGGRTLIVRESWDGSESTTPSSGIQVAYDDTALYLAARHPAKDTAALRKTSPLGGSTDWMEIFFQNPATNAGPVFGLRGFPNGDFESVELDGDAAPLNVAREKSVSYGSSLEADDWECEWRIPFAASGLTPCSTPRLSFNVVVRRAAGDAWLAWCGTGGAFSEVSRAGTLLFPGEFAAASDLPRDGLTVWLDAADGSTLTKDPTGAVSLWKDKSGSNHHARQDNARHRPLYIGSALNGKPAVRFNETVSTRLELPDLSDGKISATVFVVFSNPQAGSPVNHDPRLIAASDGKGYDYQVGIAMTVPGMQTGGPRQSMASFKDRWAKRVRIGCFSPNNQTYFTGDIAEILVYSRVLAPEEQDGVRAYLMTKWELDQ